jgi:hypothetical protein
MIPMPHPRRIEGYAIVSEDGMLANASGIMPDQLKFEADQKFFERGLDGVDVVVHGRINVRQVSTHPFDLLFSVANIAADFRAFGAKGRNNVRFAHVLKICGDGKLPRRFRWRLRHNTGNFAKSWSLARQRL